VCLCLCLFVCVAICVCAHNVGNAGAASTEAVGADGAPGISIGNNRFFSSKKDQNKMSVSIAGFETLIYLYMRVRLSI
jgi:hypothetical protein